MKKRLLLGAVCAALVSADLVEARVRPPVDCEALEGLAAILARPGLRYLLVGDTHGTAEAPALFGDIVCAAADRPLAVGVEWPAVNQLVLDAFMSERNPHRAEMILRTAPALRRPDGRGSAAMIGMLKGVWRLGRSGRTVSLTAFDYEIAAPGTSNEREAAMAEALLATAAEKPEALVVALTGSGHADKEGFVSLQPPVRSMVQHLPAEAAVSIAMSRVGGEGLVCRREAGIETCDRGPLQAREALTPRGVGPGRPGFDAIVSPGQVYTASPAGQARDPH